MPLRPRDTNRQGFPDAATGTDSSRPPIDFFGDPLPQGSTEGRFEKQLKNTKHCTTNYCQYMYLDTGVISTLDSSAS